MRRKLDETRVVVKLDFAEKGEEGEVGEGGRGEEVVRCCELF